MRTRRLAGRLALAAFAAGLFACRQAPSERPGTAAPTVDARALAVDAPPLEFVERLTAGARPDRPLPLIIAVHGLGDRPEHFIRLFDELPFPARVVAPRAPTPHGRGHRWFRVREILPRLDDGGLVTGVRTAAGRLAALARWLARHRPTQGRPVVAGFSQGGILSFALAAAHPDVVAAAVPVAGALPPALHPTRPVTVPVHALHGDADPVVPFAWGEATVAAFRRAGGRATLRRYPGVQHRVSARMRAELYAVLRRLVHAPAR